MPFLCQRPRGAFELFPLALLSAMLESLFGGVVRVDAISYSRAPDLQDCSSGGDPAANHASCTGSLRNPFNFGDNVNSNLAVFSRQDAGGSSAACADLDGDGDADCVVVETCPDLSGGSGAVTSYYLQNDGTPSFTVAVNPLAAAFASVPTHTASLTVTSVFLALGDIDGDGLVDALVAYTTKASGSIRFVGKHLCYLNTGTAASPVFTALPSSAADPFSQALFMPHWQPVLQDFDHDGNVDLIANDYAGVEGITYFNQTRRGVFVGHDRSSDLLSNPFARHFVSGERLFFTCGDVDGDGDTDCVVGKANSRFYYCKNVGTAKGPEFIVYPFTDLKSPFNSGGGVTGSNFFHDGDGVRPHLVDCNGDGKLDMIATYYKGLHPTQYFYFRNKNSPHVSHHFGIWPQQSKFNPFSFNHLFGVGNIDVDVDTRIPRLHPTVFHNTGLRISLLVGVPELQFSDGTLGLVYLENNFEGERKHQLDAENLPDMFFPHIWGSSSNPFYTAFVAHPQHTSGKLYSPSPACGDFDGDGDSDCLILFAQHCYPGRTVCQSTQSVSSVNKGKFGYFRNKGDDTFDFFDVDDVGNPAKGLDIATPLASWTDANGLSESAHLPFLSCGDIDNDGDLDCLVSAKWSGSVAAGTTFVLLNGHKVGNTLLMTAHSIGTKTHPWVTHHGHTVSISPPNDSNGQPIKIFAQTGTHSLSFDHFRSATIVDLNADGKADIVSGSSGSGIEVWHAKHDTSTKVEFEMSAASSHHNPFYGIDVGTESVVACADFNGDSFPECIVSSSGRLFYWLRDKNLLFNELQGCNDHGTFVKTESEALGFGNPDLLGQCSCKAQWDGRTCDICSSGRYGKRCEFACPGRPNKPCHSKGICSEGLAGTGSCTCHFPNYGGDCGMCEAGYFLQLESLNPNCKMCPSGQFAGTHEQVCALCPEGALCMGGMIAYHDDYWCVGLAHNHDDTNVSNASCYKCLSSSSCKGGENITCARGHSGRLCAICTEGYHLQSAGCTLCPAGLTIDPDTFMADVVVGFVTLLLVFLSLVGAACFKWAKHLQVFYKKNKRRLRENRISIVHHPDDIEAPMVLLFRQQLYPVEWDDVSAVAMLAPDQTRSVFLTRVTEEGGGLCKLLAGDTCSADGKRIPGTLLSFKNPLAVSAMASDDAQAQIQQSRALNDLALISSASGTASAALQDDDTPDNAPDESADVEVEESSDDDGDHSGDDGDGSSADSTGPCSESCRCCNLGCAQAVIKTLSAKWKLLVAYAQITCMFKANFAVDWPKNLDSMFRHMKFANIDFQGTAPIDCVIREWNFFNNFVTAMTTPLAVAAFFGIFAGVASLILHVAKRRSQFLRNALIRFIGFFVFLIFPTTCNTLVQLFNCVEVEGRWYIKEDVRLACDDELYGHYHAVGLVCLLLYPIGVPLSFLTLLYCNRDKMGDDEMVGADPHFVAQFGWLFQNYERRFYFWEITEFVRKLLLSSLIVFVHPGTTLQIGVAALICIIALAGTALYEPFLEDSDNSVCFVTFFSLNMTLLVALLLKSSDDLPEAYRSMESSLLVTIQFGVLTCTLYLTWLGVREQIAGGIENAKAVKEQAEEVRQKRAKQRLAAASAVAGTGALAIAAKVATDATWPVPVQKYRPASHHAPTQAEFAEMFEQASWMVRGQNPDGSESLFLEMDTDGSGALNKQELKDGLTGILGIAAGSELDSMLAVDDVERLSEIRLIELIALRNAHALEKRNAAQGR